MPNEREPSPGLALAQFAPPQSINQSIIRAVRCSAARSAIRGQVERPVGVESAVTLRTAQCSTSVADGREPGSGRLVSRGQGTRQAAHVG
jgi:hypothetical protein